ncbi:MAG: DUF6122 family protein [Bacteroidales bacterium]|nr:DUF6122 family protein [Bacteroidales bacterium]
MPELREIIHYGLHFILPGIVAFTLFRSKFKMAWLIMIFAMIIDLDHLLANPVFDANRCSIGFHPLHSYFAIGIYFLFLANKKLRILAIGLLLHILVDFTDCFLMRIM